MNAENTAKSITTGELCLKLVKLEQQIEHLRKKVCGRSLNDVIEYVSGDRVDMLLAAQAKFPQDDNELVQPGACSPIN